MLLPDEIVVLDYISVASSANTNSLIEKFSNTKTANQVRRIINNLTEAGYIEPYQVIANDGVSRLGRRMNFYNLTDAGQHYVKHREPTWASWVK